MKETTEVEKSAVSVSRPCHGNFRPLDHWMLELIVACIDDNVDHRLI